MASVATTAAANTAAATLADADADPSDVDDADLDTSDVADEVVVDVAFAFDVTDVAGAVSNYNKKTNLSFDKIRNDAWNRSRNKRGK